MSYKTVGIPTIAGVIKEVLGSFDLPTQPQIECVQMPFPDGFKVRVYSPWFKSVEDYVDDAWERNWK